MRRLLLLILLGVTACHGSSPTSPIRRTTATSTSRGSTAGSSPAPTSTPVTTQSSSQPTPSPQPGSLTIGTADQPDDTWAAWSPLTMPRAGMAAGLLGSDVVAAEGANRPSMDLLTSGADGWSANATYDAQNGSAPLRLATGLAGVAGAVDGSSLLAIGGHTSLTTNSYVYEYDATGFKGVFVQLPVALDEPAAGVVGQSLLVAGGADGSTIVNTVEKVDLTTQQITSGATMPLGVAGAASTVLNGELYVFGGFSITNGAIAKQSMVQIYDPATNTWRSTTDGKAGAPPALVPARHSAAACALNGKIYVFGGLTDKGLVAPVAIYDPAANTWSSGAPMPTPRAMLAAVAVNGYALVLGGFDTNRRAVATVERYRP
ncbi:MAG TPA: kelch repeat-containing protein [Oscillatoriaceae cyanobacterium]